MSSASTISPLQNNPSKTIPIRILIIIERLRELLNRLTEAKNKSKPSKVQGDGRNKDEDHSRTDGDDESQTKGVHNQLEKACNELSYMIREFAKLESFEVQISTRPLETLEDNVNDIVTDLKQGLTDSIKQLIERNLKVLRSNITKVKIQIPLQHQVSSAGSDASRYLQTTVASKEGGYLPDPYEAKEIFDSGSFVREFQDHYFKDLNDRLKLCLLCFAIFPVNAEIKERLLDFWWIGEKLSPDEKGFVKKTLETLVKMGFVEPVPKKNKSRATGYKMHPIIRALIIKLAKEADFFDYDYKGNPTMDMASEKTCLVKSEGPSLFSKKVKKEQEQPRDRYLADLQTLFNVSTQFPELPEELFSKMRNIGVLYLGRWERTAERHIEVENTESFIGLKNMKMLKFFSLQGISGISELPESVCKLSDLRILDLRACHNLEKLHKSISSLEMLTHLDLSECYLLDIVPKELSHLKKLEVLKGFVISKISSCRLDHLTKLRNLKKLSINVNNDDFSINEAGDVFSKLTLLKKLKIAWGAGGQGAPKSTEGNKENNGGKSIRKKVNGNRDAAAKSKEVIVNTQNENRDHAKKKQGRSDAVVKSKEVVKTQDENRDHAMKKQGSGAAAAKANEVVKTQDENPEAKKQGIDAAAKFHDVAKNQDENIDSKKQGSNAVTKSGFKLKLEKLKIACGAGRAKKVEKTEEGMKLEKLDLQCFPKREPPSWLVPEKLTSLKRLYIKGGSLSNLCESSNKPWGVEILRLKFLTDIKASWKELQTQFPKLEYLEKVNCPQITFCPCDANGVWMSKQA